ncbi:TlpA disulfide reductase family protein [Meiothermus hypogaeus]|uniref:Thioredoxin domain-containing protein n=1 Tax=Meiothermus hypogaeus NBRC 106114 TaxID=1227553 RepID=A0A511QZX7_9DEIN|nr:hypothetical protein MHY01S_07630 [Meiothermus hypogaeus NBRC 106114]
MRFWAGILVVVLLGGLFWWGLRRGPSPRPCPLRSPRGTTCPGLHHAHPEALPGGGGGSPHPLQAGGPKPVALNFRASWCPSCRREAPMLEAAWRRYKDRVLFVGINFVAPT